MITVAPADLALDFTGEEMDIAAAWHEFVQGRWPGAGATHWARFQVLPGWALIAFYLANGEIVALRRELAKLERDLIVYDTSPIRAGDPRYLRRGEIVALLRPLDLPTHDERVAEAVGCTVAEATHARLYRRALRSQP